MSLSAHLIEQYEDQKPFVGNLATPYQRTAYFGFPRNSTPLDRPQSRNFGSMDPNESWMSHHGQQSFMGGPSTQGSTSWSEERIQMLQARLRRQLGPEYVTQRQGPGGAGRLSYIEGWKVINLANDVFGFNGWSSSIVSLKTDFMDTKDGRTTLNVTAIIRITLQDGAYHEDVGCGQGSNIKDKSAALDKAQKEAVTDATKRALRTFGNVLGNCLYDKEYTKEVVKIKVPPAKFNRDDLERRPEFTSAGAAGPSTVPQQASNQPRPPVPIQHPQPVRPQTHEPLIIAPGTPLRSISDPPGDVFMDESFDAEFLDMGDESFLDQIDRSSVQPDVREPNNASYALNAQAGPSRLPQQAEQPAYQHRHRPDAPNVAQQAQQPARPQQQNYTNMAKSKSQEGNQAGQVGSKPNSGHSTGSGTVSGASGHAPPEAPKPRPVGGFAVPNGGSGSCSATNPSANAAAASARRQAMALAMNPKGISPSPPIRAESPKIPSGGVDHVAAKATTKLKTEGVNLRLDENGLSEDGENITMGGFTSARGVKRNNNDDRRSASPTKPSPGYGQGQRGSNGQANRMALAELKAGIAGGGMQEDWNAKRSRMG